MVVAAALFLALLLCGLTFHAPKYRIARIRVVDATGRPIPDAKVKPESLITKPDQRVEGNWGWNDSVPNDPVSTDKDGYARVPYSHYIFEKIETGSIQLSISHPDYVFDQVERVVSDAPLDRARWRVWLEYFWGRIKQKKFVVRPDPVVLQRGAILKLVVRPDSLGPRNTPLFAQITFGPGRADPETNFWTRPGSGVLMTRRLWGGPCSLRAIRFDSQGWAWFGDVIQVQMVSGQTNEVVVDLKRGVALRGQLDASTPRPIANGRVIVDAWPVGGNPYGPEWHAWRTIAQDGTFIIGSVPEGELEIVAQCDGFISASGPGNPKIRHPQKHFVGTNGLTINIGMEQAARLEVHVTDDKGKPLKDAHVKTRSNNLNGRFSAVVRAADLYNTADLVLSKVSAWAVYGEFSVVDFEDTTDSSGLAILPSLPADVTSFYVDHPQFELPKVTNFFSPTARGITYVTPKFNLVVGTTNRVSVQLVPRGPSPFSHH